MPTVFKCSEDVIKKQVISANYKDHRPFIMIFIRAYLIESHLPF